MLFREYALDPRLLSNWKDFRFFYEAFGWGTGRLIARYPKRWKRLVFESLGDCTPIEKKKIEERMARMHEKMVIRNSEWDPAESDWLANAENEHRVRPFYRLVALDNPREHPDVLLGADVDEDDEAWRMESGMDVERQAPELASVIRHMLRSARSIYLIDPHFAPDRTKFVRSLKAFIDVCHSDRTCTLETFEYHTTDKHEAGFFRHKCADSVAGILRVGETLRFVRWKQRPGGEKLHDRFVLTDLGGVRYTVGLDCGQEGETTGIEILSRTSFEKATRDYLSKTPAFDFVDDFVLEGGAT